MKLEKLIPNLYSGVKLERFDIVIRYLFVKEHMEGGTSAEHLYTKLLRERLKYAPERLKDYSPDKFRELIDDIALTGIKEPIIIDKNNKPIGGSHRLACAMYLNIDVPVKKKDVSFKTKSPFNVDWFMDNGFTQDEILYLIEKEKNIFKQYKPEKDIVFEEKLKTILASEKQKFGYVEHKPSFYQGFDDLGIVGQRSSELRFHEYKLDKILDWEQDVLDIGCNCGFFSMVVSKYVRSVDGIDTNKSLIDIANMTKDYLNFNTCMFRQSDFDKFLCYDRYDVILCLAVDKHITMDINSFINKIQHLLKPDGFLVFESHNVETLGKSFDNDLEWFFNHNYKVVHSGDIKDDGIIKRKFVVLQKPNKVKCRWCDANIKDDEIIKSIDDDNKVVYGCPNCLQKMN